MAQPQQLGHKDAGLFRQVVRHFEAKQYKKGWSPTLLSGRWLTESMERSQSRRAGIAEESSPC